MGVLIIMGLDRLLKSLVISLVSILIIVWYSWLMIDVLLMRGIFGMLGFMSL